MRAARQGRRALPSAVARLSCLRGYRSSSEVPTSRLMISPRIPALLNSVPCSPFYVCIKAAEISALNEKLARLEMAIHQITKAKE